MVTTDPVSDVPDCESVHETVVWPCESFAAPVHAPASDENGGGAGAVVGGVVGADGTGADPHDSANSAHAAAVLAVADRMRELYAKKPLRNRRAFFYFFGGAARPSNGQTD